MAQGSATMGRFGVTCASQITPGAAGEVGLDDAAVGVGELPACGYRDTGAVAVRRTLKGDGFAGGGEPAPPADALIVNVVHTTSATSARDSVTYVRDISLGGKPPMLL